MSLRWGAAAAAAHGLCVGGLSFAAFGATWLLVAFTAFCSPGPTSAPLEFASENAARVATLAAAVAGILYAVVGTTPARRAQASLVVGWVAAACPLLLDRPIPQWSAFASPETVLAAGAIAVVFAPLALAPWALLELGARCGSAR